MLREFKNLNPDIWSQAGALQTNFRKFPHSTENNLARCFQDPWRCNNPSSNPCI